MPFIGVGADLHSRSRAYGLHLIVDSYHISERKFSRIAGDLVIYLGEKST